MKSSRCYYQLSLFFNILVIWSLSCSKRSPKKIVNKSQELIIKLTLRYKSMKRYNDIRLNLFGNDQIVPEKMYRMLH